MKVSLRMRRLCYVCCCLLLINLALLFAGCSDNAQAEQPAPTTESAQEWSTGDDVMESSAVLLQKELYISESRAHGAMKTMTQAGVDPDLKKVKLVSKTSGIKALVTDSKGNTYYLAFGGLDFLELIRRDSADGEIIYGMIQ